MFMILHGSVEMSSGHFLAYGCSRAPDHPDHPDHPVYDVWMIDRDPLPCHLCTSDAPENTKKIIADSYVG